MAKQPTFETPEIREFREIPALQEGAMAHSQPFVASAEHQEALGFPGELVDDWQEKAIDKMGDLHKKYWALPECL
ncbi:MAG: (Fe-S)-binding protein, partial [Proteobacteria bacterium]|nr:(Fe-S)-binding protein [Pseudomonadota bacterium]